MNIPNFENIQFVQNNKFLTDNWQRIMQNLFSVLQTSLGTNGFVVTQLSSDPNSVTPPTAGGQLLHVQNTFGQQNGVQPGTVVFDPFEPNGAAANGQLKVLLNDGTFHNITNT